jgi:pimeloyl-ACP methyl ester carboxylesterase
LAVSKFAAEGEVTAMQTDTESRLDGPQPVQVPGPDGHSVALHDFGGEGPPLLFAHATGMHGWTWSIIARHLADQFHCWALDFRGHGESAVEAIDDLHFEGLARDVYPAHLIEGQLAGAVT